MKHLKTIFIGLNLLPHRVWAAEAVNTVAPSSGVFKMLFGLAIVLIVMAIIAWVAKRLLPNIAQNQQAIARVVSSVSVGTRERVVVVQVADRWLVVGVAPGQVNAIANLEIGAQQTSEASKINHLDKSPSTLTAAFAPSFAEWLQKSTAKFIHKSSANNQ